MSSYVELPPNKKGEPGIKITIELGYDETTGERIRDYKTVRLKSLSTRAIKNAIKEAEIEARENLKKNNNIVKGMTVGRFIKELWEDLHLSKLAPRTQTEYKKIIDKSIYPYFEKHILDKITPLNIEKYFKHELDAGNKNFKNKYIVLKSIFSFALNMKLIGENPTETIQLPQNEKKERELKHYDEKDLALLLEKLHNANPKHRLAFKLAFMLGLRRSEIAGLTHDSIDYEHNKLFINKQLHYNEKNKTFSFGPPKNKKSRTIIVPELFMCEIKEYAIHHRLQKLDKQRKNEWCPAITEDETEMDLLYTNNFGYPVLPNSLSRAWSKFVKLNDLKDINLHGLRHTFASYAIVKGVNFKTIQEQLGHSHVNMSIGTYGHLTDEDKAKDLKIFNKLM
ncbi:MULTISPECIES: tyrosine-type recombinase/integrase [unclassified Lysinibacillus]|uniref:tyrosine-type recombinase/integrase n=1 Tax=unclassified Lysinibacillus TaxID=2636778 RepID=UPI00201B407C|nr:MULTISPECIES: site-specific integrase [unclassified Lysinibacillus]